MSTTKPQTLNFQFIFEMLIIFTLNTSEMRVIFVVLISAIFALYPPNMSFLRELFSNLPSSGKYFKTFKTLHLPGFDEHGTVDVRCSTVRVVRTVHFEQTDRTPYFVRTTPTPSSPNTKIFENFPNGTNSPNTYCSDFGRPCHLQD